MRYLNLGCGQHFSTRVEWTNLDFVSRGNEVMAHNLLKGIPFPNDSFDLVYHSHILEHFSKEDGESLIEECFRVLKPGGIIRIAVPDLERIVRQYLVCLENGIENSDSKIFAANYEWILLEMYDQTVRNQTAGKMGDYLFQKSIVNEDFVYERIGEEGRELRKIFLQARNSTILLTKSLFLRNRIKKIVNWIKHQVYERLLFVSGRFFIAYRIGKFRLSGEIHQWMYDRYSLTLLLQSKGGNNIQIRDAFTSYIENWEGFGLDGNNKIVRKPDSLFIEATK